MNCPKCEYGYSEVIDSRMVGKAKRRRRKCCNCGKLFTGYEMYDDEYVKLIKENKAIQKIKKALEEA